MLDTLLYTSRNKAFWMQDKLKGSLIRHAYEEIKTIDELDSNDPFVNEYKEKKLQKLLNHAVETTEFYKKYAEKKVLTDFPIINKDKINENYQAFISSDYEIDKLYKISTSGSTGTPFSVYQDKVKRRRVNAEVIYYAEKTGYKLGQRLIFLRSLSDETRKTKLHQWIQNETLIDINHLDDKKVKEALTKINKNSKYGATLLAYSSTYDVLKDYFLKNGFKLIKDSNITGVVNTAEMFFDETRNTMEEVFHAKGFSRYSNQENGVIGQDEEINNVFLLNEACYITEIAHLEKDELVAEGDIGRIIITDLFNYSMPLIRYDTGDVGSIIRVTNNGRTKKAISNFGGRKIDIVYDSYGNTLSPYLVANSFWAFPEIKQFKFIQKTKDTYLIKIKTEKGFNETDGVNKMFMEILGDKATITIELVDELPALSSGKRRYIINELIQK